MTVMSVWSVHDLCDVCNDFEDHGTSDVNGGCGVHETLATKHVVSKMALMAFLSVICLMALKTVILMMAFTE